MQEQVRPSPIKAVNESPAYNDLPHWGVIKRPWRATCWWPRRPMDAEMDTLTAAGGDRGVRGQDGPQGRPGLRPARGPAPAGRVLGQRRLMPGRRRRRSAGTDRERMKVILRDADLSDDYLRCCAQVGCDGFDVMNARNFPSVLEQGYVDLKEMRALRQRIEGWGMSVHCVMPPAPVRYLQGEPGGEAEAEHLSRSVEALGRAGVPLVMIRAHLVELGSNPGRTHARGEGRAPRGLHRDALRPRRHAPRAGGRPADCVVDVEAHYERSLRLFRRLVPIAAEHGTRLILHPSDPPLLNSEWSPRRWSDIVDDVRQPALRPALLHRHPLRDGDQHLRRHPRLRPARRHPAHPLPQRPGHHPRLGGYDEMALGDGDMNMFKILLTLRAAGYDGGLQVDHLPGFAADTPFKGIASGYSVAYIRALLAALEAVPAGAVSVP